MRANRDAEAIVHLDAALAIRPGDRDASSSKGGLLGKLGRFEDALSAFQAGLAANPDAAELHYNAAFALQYLQRLPEAVVEYEQTLKLQPNFPEALNNQGLALHALGRYEEAAFSFDGALKWRPAFPRALNNRGIALAQLRRFDEAIQSYDAAIRFDPSYREAFNNRGIALHEMGRFKEAVADYARASSLATDWAEPRINAAFTLLLLGEFEKGLPQFEWRPAGRFGSGQRPSGKPLWQGEDLAGKTLLLSAEQGLGDTIQFSRYARLMESRGARVVLQTQPALRALLTTLGGDIALVSVGDPLPAHDLQRGLLSMPAVLGTRSDSIPSSGAYLAAETERTRKWREVLERRPAELKIGIAWRGRPSAVVDQGRSIALSEFHVLSNVPGVRLVSLQKDAEAGEFARLPTGMTVETLESLDEGADAFLDTAAVMANLDLVVTSDTAIAHLAGALGRPVWVALKKVPDWRWLLEREDSPWYPSMRLFRQRNAGDWRDVFRRMAEALHAQTSGT